MGDDAASASCPADSQTQTDESTAAGHGVESVKRELCRLVASSLSATAPGLDVEPMLEVSKPSNGDYQCNNAMSLFSRIGGPGTNFQNPKQIGQAIANNLPPSTIIESKCVAGPGYVNMVISNDWIAEGYSTCLSMVSNHGHQPCRLRGHDFSSPNIAKEMHVGHVRSTIIGDTLARMFEYASVEVLRRNHVGDGGTQFGMLIEFLFEKFPDWGEVGNQTIGDLQTLYKASKERFDDEESDFKDRARQAVVQLQGESFYNPYIPPILEELTKKGLITESDSARVIFIEGQKNPLIVVKSDGGFNYASTDLAALWYRLNVEKAECVIYVTDVGQQDHFQKIFSAASMAGWLQDEKENRYPKTNHVGFGLVLGLDGKRFRTRCTEVVRLVDLLDEAKSQCKTELIQRLSEKGKIADWTDEELDKTSEAIGFGAVKYADLKNNRLTDYTFSFERMLSDKGNTAVYLQYAHARICSIIRKANKDIEELKERGAIAFVDAEGRERPEERALGLHLIRFQEVVEAACNDLFPHYLCDYLYGLSEAFSKFYVKCPVIGGPEETSRLLLCEATAVVMRQCFHLLGITPVYKL
ncbi:hypothetical protein ACP4OV_022089 [Aristida adscensionis]